MLELVLVGISWQWYINFTFDDSSYILEFLVRNKAICLLYNGASASASVCFAVIFSKKHHCKDPKGNLFHRPRCLVFSLIVLDHKLSTIDWSQEILMNTSFLVHKMIAVIIEPEEHCLWTAKSRVNDTPRDFSETCNFPDEICQHV